jgi:hypothetical protein
MWDLARAVYMHALTLEGHFSPLKAPPAEFFHLVVSGGHVMKWNLSSKNDGAFSKNEKLTPLGILLFEM